MLHIIWKFRGRWSTYFGIIFLLTVYLYFKYFKSLWEYEHLFRLPVGHYPFANGIITDNNGNNNNGIMG